MTRVLDPILKSPHSPGCLGSLHRLRPPFHHGDTGCGAVHADRLGRVGNGGIVMLDYRCNRSWEGCPARVLVPESAVGALARTVEEHP